MEDQRADTANIVMEDQIRADTANIVPVDAAVPNINEEQRAEYSVLPYLPLYRAALTNDWKAAQAIFKKDRKAYTAKITYLSETALHIAVGTNSSHSFVDNLVGQLGEGDLCMQTDRDGNTSLHCAAKVGNTKAARVLVTRCRKMIMIENKNGNTALKLAALYAQKETLVYLLEEIPNNEVEEGRKSPYSGKAGGDLITKIITAGFYDVALKLIMRYPNLVTEEDNDKLTALVVLATNPRDFLSWRPWFWQYLIHFFPCRMKNDTKLVQTYQLMKDMITIVLDKDKGKDKVAWDILGAAMFTAARHGIYEFVEECLGRCPGLIWYKNKDDNLFLVAIKHRQVRVYNLLYQMTGHVALIATTCTADTEDNPLHIVGKKPPMHMLQYVTSAAFQMQRELQWFEEVEKAMTPYYKKALNKEKKSPRMVFTEEHADLMEKGEKWMKDTALSCTLVAALIITVTFAAIFTVPGGNNDKDGTPIFLRDTTFMVFAISDIVALFAAVTSVLMFLGIHISRFAEHDFIRRLPKKLSIGLLSLFISLVAICAAFCAATGLVLRGNISWILLLSGTMGWLPVITFNLLQFPLLVELFMSAYGPNIFHKQNKLKLH